MKIFKQVKKYTSTLVAIVLTSIAHAETVVTPAVTAQMADTQADLLTVGTALIGLAVLVLALKWVKAMLF